MSNEFKPADIIWVKNVTDHAVGHAYFPFTGLLHFPDHFVPGNLLHPAVNEIILIRQSLHGNRAFTHLVSPIDNAVVDENIHPGFRWARRVQLIAITPLNNPILVQNTNFRHLWTQGNACTIEAKHRPRPGYQQLQEAIWTAFEQYFAGAQRL